MTFIVLIATIREDNISSWKIVKKDGFEFIKKDV